MDTNIAYCIRHVTNIPDSILTGDVNTHLTRWYSHTDDHRGQLISDIIRHTSPDITTISTTLYNRTTWRTIHALNSDYLLIITTINTRTKYKLQQNRHTFTNYRKALDTIHYRHGCCIFLTFNHHQIYTLQKPSSQTSFSMQTITTSKRQDTLHMQTTSRTQNRTQEQHQSTKRR